MSEKWDEAPPVDASYAVVSNQDVLADIVIGSGQFGTVGVRLDGSKVAAGEERLHVKLGTGADVRGKRLRITAVVHDVNPMTNRTEVTYTISGGGSPQSFHSEFLASRDWGVVFHVATISLV